jgi:hypothetical protein
LSTILCEEFVGAPDVDNDNKPVWPVARRLLEAPGVEIYIRGRPPSQKVTQSLTPCPLGCQPPWSPKGHHGGLLGRTPPPAAHLTSWGVKTPPQPPYDHMTSHPYDLLGTGGAHCRTLTRTLPQSAAHCRSAAHYRTAAAHCRTTTHCRTAGEMHTAARTATECRPLPLRRPLPHFWSDAHCRATTHCRTAGRMHTATECRPLPLRRPLPHCCRTLPRYYTLPHCW